MASIKIYSDSLSATRERLDRFVAEFRQIDAASETGAVRSLIAEFVDFANTLDADCWQRLVGEDPSVLEYRETLAPHYANYLRDREFEEAEQLLSKIQPGDGQSGIAALLNADFGRRAYDRVADMFEMVDFSTCRRFVMVGCGPLPVTLLHVLDRTDVAEAVGLDINQRAVAMANQLGENSGLKRLRTLVSNGAGFDFTGADLVYIANMVSPKARILSRIVDQTPGHTRIILRDPHSIGALLAETGVADLDARLEYYGDGSSSQQFLSKHVFLRRVDG